MNAPRDQFDAAVPARLDMTALVPTEVFAPGGLNPILERVAQEARAQAAEADPTTDRGRKALVSVAYRVARSKTALDDMGKELVAGLKRQTGAIDADRRKAREALDALRDEIRWPVDEFEAREKARIAAHEGALAAIPALPEWGESASSETLRGCLNELENYPPRDWQEFEGKALAAIQTEIYRTKALLADAEKREVEAAEAARRAEEERERAAEEAERRRQEEIRQAAERARAEAEAKARREAEEAERRAQAERERMEREAREAEAGRTARAGEARGRRARSAGGEGCRPARTRPHRRRTADSGRGPPEARGGSGTPGARQQRGRHRAYSRLRHGRGPGQGHRDRYRQGRDRSRHHQLLRRTMTFTEQQALHHVAYRAQAPDPTTPTPWGNGTAAPHITVHRDLVQGSDEWFQARRGLLTASEMRLIMTPKGKPADNPKSRTHFWELLAQRISAYVEPSYVGDDMLRGHEEECRARIAYNEHVAPVEDVGFITNDRWGFTLGYSPDGLIGSDGLIEVKSRRQKYHVETIMGGGVPDEFRVQIQTGLLVSGRQWCDFISYHGGLPMLIVRVEPDPEMQAAIIDAATAFEERMIDALASWRSITADGSRRLLPTERVIEQEMVL